MSRAILLPPYLAAAPLWPALMDSIDKLFEDTDSATKQLRNIRDPYPVSPLVQSAIDEGTMFDSDSFEYQQDLSLLLKQLEFVGMPLSNPSYVSTQQALMLFRNAAAYWYMKGTGKIVDFINFTMGSSLSMYPMWTNDYVNFYREGDPAIGLSIASGGGWYPTTHVSIDVGPSSVFSGLAFDSFISFFNDIFNYNLVLDSVVNESTIKITTNDVDALMLSMNIYVEVEQFVPGN